MFCASCEHRPARCHRRCERTANGRHLWQVVQAELMRDRPGAGMPQLAWDNQPADIQRAFIAGAQAMREMAR